MKNRSFLVNLLTAALAIIGSYGALFGETAQAWLGIVSFALTLLLNNKAVTDANFTKGWDWTLWGTNIAGIVILILGQVADSHLASANVINGVVVGINLVIMYLFKYYGNGQVGAPTERKLV